MPDTPAKLTSSQLLKLADKNPRKYIEAWLPLNYRGRATHFISVKRVGVSYWHEGTGGAEGVVWIDDFLRDYPEEWGAIWHLDLIA